MVDAKGKCGDRQGKVGFEPSSLATGGCPEVEDGAYVARRLLSERARIGRYLDADLFADPAYDILLDLFVSGEEGRAVSMSNSACIARVPRTTALRWVRLLEERGLVELYADEGDRRSTLLRLSTSARASVMSYLRHVGEGRRVP